MWSSSVQPVIDKHDGVVDIHSAPDICMYRRRVVLWLWSGKRDETKNGNIAGREPAWHVKLAMNNSSLYCYIFLYLKKFNYGRLMDAVYSLV